MCGHCFLGGLLFWMWVRGGSRRAEEAWQGHLALGREWPVHYHGCGWAAWVGGPLWQHLGKTTGL